MLRTLALASLLLPALAHARDWTVDPSSTLGFTCSYQGEAFAGRFKTFDAKIAYDPADPATGAFDVTVDLGSADTGNAERDDSLKGGDFFAVSTFPKAHFVTDHVAKAADGSVSASGSLTIRDRTRPVTLKVVFAATGDAATLDVDTTLKRADFGLGAGSDWTDVASDVPVHAHLVLHGR